MNISSSPNAFQSTISGSLQDGRVDRSELRQISAAVNNTSASASEKKDFMNLAQTIQKATSGGLFRSEDVSPAEMKDIVSQAENMKDSPLVKDMMSEFNKTHGNSDNPIADFFKALFEGLAAATKATHATSTTSPADLQSYRSAISSANSVDFSGNSAQGSGTTYQSLGFNDGVSGPSGPAGVPGQTASVDGDNAFVPQFSEGTASEKQANCGAACAAMMISSFGVNPPPSMSEIRADAGARRGNGSGAFAMSTEQVIKAVEANTGKSGRVSDLPVSANTAGKEIAERLNAGKNVIILTGGMGGSKGHYMMVKGVEFDARGNIKALTVDDPGSQNGEDRVISGAKLQEIMGNRSSAGRVNQLLTFG
jgi:hypothetical protein